LAKQAIVLIGMPGAGKTRVGQAVAQLLQWRWVDTDVLIADAVGCAFGDYIESHGIDAARAVERDVVSRLPGRCDQTVVSVGGGTVLDPANREALAAIGPVVWLGATTETLLDRIGSGDDRPLLKGDPAGKLPALLAERTPIYEELATVIVDVDGRDAYENAGEVVKQLVE
jgi:shikimate kinase